ncbi:hypothetical protein V2J52_14830 [Georgenia sp. MJ173]|uniref:hypothetical protein n=1 Tax=Georgenia sunbinii TaxID=3117728 RepID=UPI002F26CDC1
MGPPADGLVAQSTYRYLRLMMITLPTLLLVATALAFFWLGTIETSISAYYLGPIRDVFVGVLMAAAACLVVYRGSSPLEDFALDVAGFFAIFVALVPTRLDLTLADLDAPRRADLITALQASTVAVLVVSALFILVEVRTAPWKPAPLGPHRPTRVVAAVTNAVLVLFVAFVVLRVMEGQDFAGVHGAAAVLLIASLAVAVASHGWPGATGAQGSATDAARRDHRGKYRTIFLLMVAGAPLFGLLNLLGWDYALLAVEWYEIALFALFWVLETGRTWSKG